MGEVAADGATTGVLFAVVLAAAAGLRGGVRRADLGGRRAVSGEKWPIAYEGRDVAETGTPFSMLTQRLPKLMIRIKNTAHNVMGTCKSLPGNPRSFAC